MFRHTFDAVCYVHWQVRERLEAGAKIPPPAIAGAIASGGAATSTGSTTSDAAILGDEAGVSASTSTRAEPATSASAGATIASPTSTGSNLSTSSPAVPVSTSIVDALVVSAHFWPYVLLKASMASPAAVWLHPSLRAPLREYGVHYADARRPRHLEPLHALTVVSSSEREWVTAPVMLACILHAVRSLALPFLAP